MHGALAAGVLGARRGRHPASTCAARAAVLGTGQLGSCGNSWGVASPSSAPVRMKHGSGTLRAATTTRCAELQELTAPRRCRRQQRVAAAASRPRTRCSTCACAHTCRRFVCAAASRQFALPGAQAAARSPACGASRADHKGSSSSGASTNSTRETDCACITHGKAYAFVSPQHGPRASRDARARASAAAAGMQNQLVLSCTVTAAAAPPFSARPQGPPPRAPPPCPPHHQRRRHHKELVRPVVKPPACAGWRCRARRAASGRA